MPAPGVLLRVLSRPEPSLERLQRRHGVSRGATTSVAPIGPDPRSHGATRAGAICVGLLPPRVQVRRVEGGRGHHGLAEGALPAARAAPSPPHHWGH